MVVFDRQKIGAVMRKVLSNLLMEFTHNTKKCGIIGLIIHLGPKKWKNLPIKLSTALT